MELIRTRRPTKFRDLKDQEESLFSILSRSPCQELCFRAKSVKGSLTYFMGREEIDYPRILELFHCVIVRVLKKNI